MPANLPRKLGTIRNKKEADVEVFEDDELRVYFTADADIDADGANGQSGAPAAYRDDDSGTDYLENGGMKINRQGKVVCEHDWGRNVAILDTDGEPKVFPGGIVASKTWYRHKDKAASDPAAYVDSETVPYIAVPPLIIKETEGIVRGCKARVTYKGKFVDCVVADSSGETSIGELSIAAARKLGIPESPKNGGLEVAEVLYELWPGQAAPGYELQRA